TRVTWQQSMEFCRWLSDRTDRKFSLPTEAQWEWACRAGSRTDLWFGSIDDDFSKFGNLADASRQGKMNPFPRADRFNDGHSITGPAGQYEPNPWGLHDMHGNVAEWTRSTYMPYPYDPADGRNAIDNPARKVARGGSWRDVPARARSAYRVAYQPWQPVHNVGFRVIMEAE
ncbi:MAG TPA: formylglycine-generating enzyme family protein, partial [Thermoguttaceae bacterium]|nr:formylglycine-generating enzyme family protein [Thermoguttaceae bacterium]